MPGVTEDIHHPGAATHRIALERVEGHSQMMEMHHHKDASPYPIPPKLFAENRQKLCTRLQKTVCYDVLNEEGDSTTNINNNVMSLSSCAGPS